jgi:hypothetical protein
MLEIGVRKRHQGVNPREILRKPLPESAYKYKISPRNGRNVEEIKEELSLRKIKKFDKVWREKQLMYLKEKSKK